MASFINLLSLHFACRGNASNDLAKIYKRNKKYTNGKGYILLQEAIKLKQKVEQHVRKVFATAFPSLML